MYSIKADKINKKFGNLSVLTDISFSIKKGESVVILGPSGCGKTTLIKILAGITPYDGKIFTKIKHIGVVFQESRLFPWLTVMENAKMGMELQGRSVDEKYVAGILEELEILEFKDSYPHQISGGMKQKVALARVLVTNPKIILLDEPFASLDIAIRKKFQQKIMELRKKGVAIVFVTHNIDEAVKLGQKIIILSKRPAKIRAVLTREKNIRREIMRLMG